MKLAKSSVIKAFLEWLNPFKIKVEKIIEESQGRSMGRFGLIRVRESLSEQVVR